MHPYHRYRALSSADRRLVREAALLLAVARLGLAVLPFRLLQRALARKRGREGCSPDPNEHAARPGFSIERVGWAVAAAGRRLPFRTTCLVDSLAANAMLRRRGYAPELRFGVRPPDGGMLAAHAWVELEGEIVCGEIPSLADYSVLSASIHGASNGSNRNSRGKS